MKGNGFLPFWKMSACCWSLKCVLLHNGNKHASNLPVAQLDGLKENCKNQKVEL